MKTYYDLLVRLSKETQEMGLIHAGLSEIWQFLNEHPLFQKVLTSPVVNYHKKKSSIDKLFYHKIDKRVLSFFLLLVLHNRLYLLPYLLEKYLHHIEECTDKITITVITAETMNLENQRSLQEKLEEVYKKQMQLLIQIDPDILGGFILIFPNHKLLDLSLKSRLNQLKLQLERSTPHAL